MSPREFLVRGAVALALLGAVGPAPAAADGDPTVVCDDVTACPEIQTGAPVIEVAGVQVSADDAREAGEVEPFIINDGFGD
jgi:hypothetical protein